MRVGYCSLHGRSGHEGGRALLARLYFEETGLPLPPILVTERGKPYFSSGEWHFSISHTKHYAFCVLARENVAIDAEELTRQVRPGLAQKILSPGELRQYQLSPDPNRALLTFWVLKEAAAKLTGEGLRGFPNETDFSLQDPRVGELGGCLVALMTQREDFLPDFSQQGDCYVI